MSPLTKTNSWVERTGLSNTHRFGVHALLTLLALVVSGCTATVAYENPQGPPPPNQGPFRGEHVQGLGNPEIFVENHAEVELTLVVDGPEAGQLRVPPNGRKMIKVRPGNYQFEGSFPNVTPVSGKKAFERDMRYTWEFTIIDPDAGKGWFCYDVGRPHEFFMCQRSLSDCQTMRTEAVNNFPGEPLGRCAPYARPWVFRLENEKGLIWFGHDEADCNRIRASVGQSYQPLGACAEKP